MQITLDHIQKLTPDIWTFWFTPETYLRFDAGQYIKIKIPHKTPDYRGEWRWMTISTAPHQIPLGITTRFDVVNGSTYKVAMQQLQAGNSLYATDPIGDFVLPKSPAVPVVFVVAGIGSTPVYSMLQHAQHTGQTRDIQLIYAAHDSKHLIFDNFFRQFPAQSFRYSPILKQPHQDWQGLTGQLSAQRIWSLVEEPQNKLFYFSGPEALIMQLVYGLHQLGLQRNQVVLDYFPGYQNNA